MAKPIRSVVHKLATALAWLIVVAAIGLWLLEESGVLVELVRLRLAWRLGPLGEGLSIERVSLRWFEPGVVIEGVSLRIPARGKDSPGGSAPEMLRLRSIHVTLSTDERLSTPVQKLHIDGGRVRISDDLLRGFDAISRSFSMLEPTLGSRLLPPRFLATNLDVELELPAGDSLELGRLEFLAQADEEEGFDIRGQILPTLSGAVPSRAAILIDGKQWPTGFRIHASARELALRTRDLALPESLEPLPIEEFDGRLTLDGEARLDWGSGSVEAHGELTGVLEATHFVAHAGVPPIDDLRVELAARFHPAPMGGLWNREAWSGTSRAQASWHGAPVDAWCLFGEPVPRPDLAKAWVTIAGLPLDALTREAISQWFPADEAWEMLGLRGLVDATLDMTLPAVRDGAGSELPHPRLCLAVRADGDLGLTYHGWKPPGRERIGVPLPLEKVEGDVIADYDERSLPRWRLGILALRGDHGSGEGLVEGTLAEPPPGALVPAAAEIEIRIPSMELGEPLRRALEANRKTRDIWSTYNPTGGRISTEWRLHMGDDVDGITAMGDVHVEDAQLAWKELPIPLETVAGELRLRWARHAVLLTDLGGNQHWRPSGVAFDVEKPAEGGAPPGTGVRVAGFTRSDRVTTWRMEEPEIPARGISGLRVEIRDLSLRGRDWEVLAGKYPQVAEQVNQLAAKGSVDAVFHGARSDASAPYRSEVEATPGVVELTPSSFPRRTRNLRGRILVRTTEGAEAGPGQSTTRVDLEGVWPDDVLVTARGRIQSDGPSALDLFVAGIDPTNSAFKGALLRAASGSELTSGDGMELSEDVLRGPLDFHVKVDLDAEEAGSRQDTIRTFLRDNDLSSGSLHLTGLHGVLEKAGDLLRGPVIRADLAGHPVELRNVLIFGIGRADRIPAADPILARSGFASDPEGLVLQADLTTRGLPLDKTHLAGILTAEQLAAVEEDFLGEGKIDVHGARIVLTRERDGQGKLAVHGRARPYDVSMRFGLPIDVDTAHVDVRELILEAGRVRGWCSIEGLEGRIADRRLGDARMILSYVDGRLTIDDLAGAFEGGRLASLGGEKQGGTALAVDLAEPHGFDLRMRLTDVRVGQLLRGVFSSRIADEGRLTLGLSLKGEPMDVLGITGEGWMRLDHGRLWSIPVVRALFGKLGLDETAVFDRVRSRFRVRGGRIRTSHIEVKSKLLYLAGSGKIDFDGALEYDLEVHYTLLDRLGPLNKLLYWLNNSLWRVAVRGDMSRPHIVIRNSILEFLRGFHEPSSRALPLPGYAQPAPRF